MKLSRVCVALTIVSILIGVAVGTTTTWLIFPAQRSVPRQAPPAALAKVSADRSKPAVRHRLGRHRSKLRFRVEDATDHKPVGLARIRIENLNLAGELGGDSEAVAWSDGRAQITHSLLVLDDQRGEPRSAQMIFQGPWISVSAPGYETRRMPLSDAVDDQIHQRSPRRLGLLPGEVVLTLDRGAAKKPDLADLAGEYEFSNGSVFENLRITAEGIYHYSYFDDVVHANDPHDTLEYQGEWSVADGVVRLVATGPFSSSEPYLAGGFIPIQWADRLFLVPEKDRLLFCSAANHAFVPRWLSRGPGHFPGRFRNRLPQGAPNLPRELKPYLLRVPVTGLIIELISQETGILNKGAKDGIRAGMLFVKEDNNASPYYTVLYVEEERCVIKDLGDYDPVFPWEGDSFPLIVGRKMSTQSVTVETNPKAK